jgi:hypothetical protein
MPLIDALAPPIRPAQNVAHTRTPVAISDLGTFGLLTRGELDSYTCTCGDPECDGDLVAFVGCGHAVLPGYSKAKGLAFLLCPRCRLGICFRVAPDA